MQAWSRAATGGGWDKGQQESSGTADHQQRCGSSQKAAAAAAAAGGKPPADLLLWLGSKWDRPWPQQVWSEAASSLDHPQAQQQQGLAPAASALTSTPTPQQQQQQPQPQPQRQREEDASSTAAAPPPHGNHQSTTNTLVLLRRCRELCDKGRVADAVDALLPLAHHGHPIPRSLLYHALKQCRAQRDLPSARRVHALAAAGGHDGDAFLGTHLIGLYAALGRVDLAAAAFAAVRPAPDAHNWAAVILAHARHGGAAQARDAIRLYRRMRDQEQVQPDDRVFSAALKACAAAADLAAGREVHADIVKKRTRRRSGGRGGQPQPDMFVVNGLVDMYAKCGSVRDARRVFDEVVTKDVVTWNAMIAGYAGSGMGEEALRVYEAMLEEEAKEEKGKGARPDAVTFVCVLQACASVGAAALEQGRRVHAQIGGGGGGGGGGGLGGGLVRLVARRDKEEDEVALGSSLVSMYAKCGSLADARRVFDGLRRKNVVTWTAMIAGYAAQAQQEEEALRLYARMRQEEEVDPPTAVTYVCVLQACAGVGAAALADGRRVHAEVAARGMHRDAAVGASLVHMYAKCGGSVEDARRAFDGVRDPDAVAWTAVVAAYAACGMAREALALWQERQVEGEQAAAAAARDPVMVRCLLQACASVGAAALDQGRRLHAQIDEQQLGLVGGDLGAAVVSMYAKCGAVDEARRVLDSLPHRDTAAWNAVIGGFNRQGKGAAALAAFRDMSEDGGSARPDAVTLVRALQACASVGAAALRDGTRIHAHVEAQGLLLLEQQQQDGDVDVVRLVGGSLVNMYAKCGDLGAARAVFDRLPVPARNGVTWTALIAGYARRGMGVEALRVYADMREAAEGGAGAGGGAGGGGHCPDPVTLVCVLQACASVGVAALEEGRRVHAHIHHRGLLLQDAGGGEQEEEQLQQQQEQQQDGGEDAGDADDGTAPPPPPPALVLGASLVDMYAKCGDLDSARAVFDALRRRDVVTWTAMIAGYAQQGMGADALSLYRAMLQGEKCVPDACTFVCLLQACASAAALPLGQDIHAHILRHGLILLPHQAASAAAASTSTTTTTTTASSLGAALVHMYAKCGAMPSAQAAFDALPTRTTESWGALITGYARHGDSHRALSLFHAMRLAGGAPDGVTLLGVLAACSHAGMVSEGRQVFAGMQAGAYGRDAQPAAEHYTCVMDMLGRAGLVPEAARLARAMPASGAGWRVVLGACRNWGDVEAGREAFEMAVAADPRDDAAYAMMAALYAGAGMAWEAAEVRARRARAGVGWERKGRSWWLDADGVAHSFGVGGVG